MSSNPPPLRTPFRLELRESLVALGLAAAFWGMWLLQFFEVPFLLLFLLSGLFASTIWLRRSWGVYLLFAILFFLKFSRVAFWQRIQLKELTYLDFVFPIVMMAFAGACFRYLEVAKFKQAFYSSSKSGGDLASQAATPRSGTLRFPSLLGGRWWLIPVASSFALLLLTVFPYDPSTVREYWMTPRGARAIFLGSFLFFLWFVCRSLYSLIMRWKMDPAQARIHIRSIFAEEFWREQAGIESRLARIKGKKRR